MRIILRKIYYLPSDMLYYLNASQETMIPPQGKMNIGSGDFIHQGNHQLELLQQCLDIQTDDSILDIGCGYGRTAVALTRFLDASALYEGVDITKPAIKWCHDRIKNKFSNFNFTWHQASNELYSKNHNAVNIDLAFNNSQFDICFLFSVFTHMLSNDIEHYLSEIQRVLKSNGKCLITMFIYDDDTESRIQANHTGHKFKYVLDDYRIMNQKVKTANVAYHKETMTSNFEKYNLEVVSYIDGYWKDWIAKSDNNSFQDIFIIKKI